MKKEKAIARATGARTALPAHLEEASRRADKAVRAPINDARTRRTQNRPGSHPEICA